METFVFLLAAAICLAGALGVVLSRNTVHSALSLVATLFGVAVLFVAQEAHFLAAVQVMVYAGAIVVLFLFVIMLLGVDRTEDLSVEPIVGQRVAAVVLGVAIFALPVLALYSTGFEATGMRSNLGPLSEVGLDIERLGELLFTRYILALEVTSVLLVIAVVGAVMLARRSPRRDEIEVPDADYDPATRRSARAGARAGDAAAPAVSTDDSDAAGQAAVGQPEDADEPADESEDEEEGR